jgi:hypothetical protein
VALIGGPVALLAGNALSTVEAGNDRERMAGLAEQSTGQQAAVLLFLLAASLLVAGLICATGTVRARGAALTHAGALLAIPGAVAFAGLVTTWLYDIALARSLPIAEAAELSAAAGDTAAAAVVLIVGLIGLPLGLTLVVAGMWRSGAVPFWAPAAVLVGFVVVSFVDNRLGGLAGDVLLIVGLGRVGLAVLRSDR